MKAKKHEKLYQFLFRIMSFHRNYGYFSIYKFINNTVFIIYSSAP